MIKYICTVTPETDYLTLSKNSSGDIHAHVHSSTAGSDFTVVSRNLMRRAVHFMRTAQPLAPNSDAVKTYGELVVTVNDEYIGLKIDGMFYGVFFDRTEKNIDQIEAELEL